MLNFIGTGSAFNTSLGNTSAFLKENDSLILLDCGSMVFSRLHTLSILNNIKNLYIILTHTHPDHIGSLGELIFFSHFIMQQKAKLFFPDKKHLQTILRGMGISDDMYTIDSSAKFVISDKNITNSSIEFFKVSHVNTIPTFGILMSIKNSTLYYSGDSNDIDGRILELLENGEIDFLYQDTSGIDYDDNPHLYIGKLLAKIKPELRHKVYCMHIDTHLDLSMVKELGFNIAKNVGI